MWGFAVGLYLVFISPNSLQLTAIYGFLTSITAILFGAFIGRWVDKTERLKAAQISLILQNTSVVICASLLIVHLHFKEDLDTLWNGSLGSILIVFVIFFGIIANLASIATKIILEKDWIVVLSGGNEKLLSKMNATMRTIDLTTFILAPILVGQIFTYGSHIIGAIFIACWNIVSGVFEYTLLIIIYRSIPQLSQKMKPLPKIQVDSPTPSPAPELDTTNVQVIPAPAPDPLQTSPTGQNEFVFDNLSEVSLVTPKSQKMSANDHFHQMQQHKPAETKSCFRRYIDGFSTKLRESGKGWKDYFSHPVRNAGLGLAFLYMTVLGFDNITTGYAYTQGVSESILGIMAAVGAVFGILGSVSFPFLRKRVGKLVTGNIGFGSETICLILCLVSIVTPGSPFTHKNKLSLKDADSECSRNNTISNDSHYSAPISELWNCNISVLLLMAGIISARFGLWMADLSVVQIFQERIPEHQRGVLNGVQGSLNQTMNLIKFLIVIILPNSDTFAYLILASWLFVFMGWMFFVAYAWRNRGERVVPLDYSEQILTVSSVIDGKRVDDKKNDNDTRSRSENHIRSHEENNTTNETTGQISPQSV